MCSKEMGYLLWKNLLILFGCQSAFIILVISLYRSSNSQTLHLKSGSEHFRDQQVYILLTVTLNINVKLHWGDNIPQQRGRSARRNIYERAVKFWSSNCTLPIIVVENSGADLRFLKRLVPDDRKASVEFLSVAPRQLHDIGAAEVSAILDVLKLSKLLRSRRSSDLIFKITGRYCIPNFYEIFSKACYSKEGHHPFLVINNPGFNISISKDDKRVRQETTVIGFTKHVESSLFNWATLGGSCFECHATDMVESILNNKSSVSPDQVCVLPHIPVIPVQEGSTSLWRDHI